ncbi:DUF6916 family protein [Longimicrobium sp.]|uniref:DUF6916 family protein n=1 Tax=Longimicrobium sp. TaxID=2029185 RepID=UPI002F925154
MPRLGAEPGTYDDFTIDRFLPRVGEVFHVVGEASEPIAILLSEITRLASDDSPIRTRMPFSLVFHAPPGVRLEQQIYRVENPEMEPFDCFLVPIGPDPFGMRFEAVYT